MSDTVDNLTLLNCRSGAYPVEHVAKIAAEFDLEPPIEVLDFPDKGNINRHTFLVLSGTNIQREYLLQMVNPQVFVNPPQLMASMMAAIEAQQACLTGDLGGRSRARGGTHSQVAAVKRPTSRVPRALHVESVSAGHWEPVTLIPTRVGKPYLALADGGETQYWRLMAKIQRARTYKSLGEIPDREQRRRVAHEAGRGLALFGAMMSSVDTAALVNPLPGYRDARGYYNQLSSILAGHRTPGEARGFLPEDDELRASTWRHYLVQASAEVYSRRRNDPELREVIERVVDERDFGLTLARDLESGAIRTVAIHGDTKLDNFLFCTESGRARALVDLDTIMPHTWLADWGDMVRSLVNVAGEKEGDLTRVQVDGEIYRALATGFLSAAHDVTPNEVGLMVDSVPIIALELAVRFLADYLRGDTYFQLGPDDPADLNKTRAMVQYTLFLRLREGADKCRTIVREALGDRA